MYGNYSSSKDWRRSDPNIRPSSVAMSYSQSPNPTKTATADEFKLSRRPVPAGKSVAALQQQHQWLMQKSSEGPSPSGSVRSSHSSAHSSNSSIQSGSTGRSSSPLVIQRFASPSHQESDDEEEQEQRMEDGGNSGMTAQPHPASIRTDQLSTSGASIKSPQAPPRRRLSTGGASQEGKVAREGWVYRKNGLMQWKQVYAVAKHGNSIKPGGLYLYKDDKFSSHIQTFDMSEAVEVEPRAQEYRAGIKWEFRILVKRDDVILATDDIATRKAWIDALTSIMGKVSMATHTELQSRIVSADQVNRELQSAVDSLQSENDQLHNQISALQRDAHRRQGEHSVREKEMANDLDDMQQAMDTRCELLEGELNVWRTKANGLEKELQRAKKSHEEDMEEQQKMYTDAIAQHKMEVAEWRARVEVLEKQGKQHQQQQQQQQQHAYYHHQSKRKPSTRSSNHRRRRRRDDDYTSSSSDNDEEDKNNQESSIKNTVAQVRYNLHALREEIKSESGPLVQSHIVEIKAGVNKLNDALGEARKGWTDLQIDMMRFFEDNNKSQHDGNADAVEKLNAQVMALRHELSGDDDDNEQELSDFKDNDSNSNKKITFAGKFDVMMQMVEMVQLSQNRLMTCYLEQAEDENKAVHIDKARMEAVQSMLEELQDKLMTTNNKESDDSSSTESQKQLRDAIAMQLESIMQGQQSQSTEILTKLDEYMTNHQQTIIEAVEKSTDEMQTRGQEEHDKNLKVLGQLLQHVITQIEASSIPDLPALSDQLEQTVERLSVMADRLYKKPIPRATDNNAESGEDEKSTALHNGAPSTSRNNSSSSNQQEQQQTLQEIQELVMGTQSFIERTLRVLDRYDNTGMEETVRRAVKSAFNSHLDVHWEQQKKSDDKDEKLMKRYEENARTHFDKSMSSMREHLEEYTGVMYRMIEDLVLRAVEHLEQQGGVSNRDNSDKASGATTEQHNRAAATAQETDYLIELHTKLSTTKDKLEAEIERLQEELQSLEVQVGGLKKTRKELDKELEEKRMALHAVKVEHETLLQNNLIEPATAALTRELEPLVHQITRLKQLASFHAAEDDASSSSGGYVDLGHLSQQQQQQYHSQYTNKSPSPPSNTDFRGSSATSANTTALHAPRQFMNERRSSFDGSSSASSGWKASSQQPPSSSSHALNGGRPRATSPLGVFLGRKS
ncbi:hypothetical protein BDB00DRAFT_806407 [Zychaea mexicana]|uniref:uncharacterized protein n=1 Tax=Zychaea mexicana TaxID=64656 RepID=UPI0022FDD73D|nr:uncharacterized protein BDB00DRAFT_806407 [Zychaea mexicana]KAI9497013.1 hypothetical protein BDB00DRAFT_806407 [Zychaea mexicana]